MTGKRVEAGVVTLSLMTCLAATLSGCALFPPQNADRLPDLPLPPEPRATAPSTDEAEEAILAAVEQFLKRTQDYGLPGPPSSESGSAPVSDGAAVANATTRDGAAGRPVRPAPPGDRLAPEHDQVSANTQMGLQDTSPTRLAVALPVVESVSIRSTVSLDAAVAEPVKINTTNEPLDVRQAETPLTIDRFLSELETGAASTNDPDAEWQLRLTQLALHRDTEAVQVSQNLPQGARSMLTALIRAAVAVRRTASDPLLSGDEAIDRVDELRTVLADRADPVVSTVALCRKVATFGVFEEMGNEDFVAGQAVQAIVYSEIRNLRSDLTDDGRHRTRLATRLEVFTADGRSVWQREEPEIVDLCRRRRTDFFIAQRLTLPPSLPAGDYVLKILVEDKLSGRVDEASHGFVIGPPTSVARRF